MKRKGTPTVDHQEPEASRPSYYASHPSGIECIQVAEEVQEPEVSHPPHYTSHPSGIECIQVTEEMNFNLGNAVKYIWRASLKGKQLQDLKKARWCVNREIARLQRSGK
jgi:hypothetical protein